MCDRILAVFLIHRHFLPVCGMPPHRPVNDTFFLRKDAFTDGMIPSRDGMVFQLLCDTGVGQVVFACNDGTRGVLVNSVHNARAHLPVNSG